MTARNTGATAPHLALVLVLASITGLMIAGCPFTIPLPGGGDDDANKPTTGTSKWAGSNTCATCHSGTHDDWEKTLHAEALATLEGIGQDQTERCLPCHTIGYGDGGFTSRTATPHLADVGCESCHGPAADHVAAPSDASKRPTVDIGSDVCGTCHVGSHHPNYTEWEESGHAQIDEHVGEYLLEGQRITSCGVCHSGDAFYGLSVQQETVDANSFANKTLEDLARIECAICHDPHARTNNAADPDTDRDYQLRYPEAVTVSPSTSEDDATDPSRFNLCGQCHHSRGRTWEATSRGPHHSVQSNMFIGEMPIPDGTTKLVDTYTSVHTFLTEQCATCHMHRVDYESEEAPAIAGHTFAIDFDGCATSGCHPSAENAEARLDDLQDDVQSRLDAIANRLGDVSTWEYSAGGGPETDAEQDALADEIKQVRFLYHYVVSDGSLGMHNPVYVEAILDKAEALLDGLGL